MSWQGNQVIAAMVTALLLRMSELATAITMAIVFNA